MKDATPTYSKDHFILANNGDFNSRSVLLNLTIADDRKIYDENIDVRTIVDTCKNNNLNSVVSIYQFRPSEFGLLYGSLSELHRGVVRRLLGFKLYWVTVYPFLSDEAWFELSKMSPKKYIFDAEGGGVWLRKHKEPLYRRVLSSTAKWWCKSIGNDGREYDSPAEAIHGSLLFHNLKLLDYTCKPRLNFNGTGTKAPRSCIGDFHVIVKPSVRAYMRDFLVENWMRIDTPAGRQSDDQIERSALARRQYKCENFARLELQFIQTESQIYSVYGSNAYVKHLIDAYREQAGLILDDTDFILPTNINTSDLDLDAKDIAKLLHANSFKTVSSAKNSNDDRIRSIVSRLTIQRNVESVEIHLAELQGRMPRTRDGVWQTTSSMGAVLMYCRHNKLIRTTYDNAYKNKNLPIGFPMSPSQQWGIAWSWRVVRGEVPVRLLIRDYQPAQLLITRWQRKTKIQIATGPEFEHWRSRSRMLKRIPKQPDNKKSGGLNGWKGWDDFLGCNIRAIAASRVDFEIALIVELDLLDSVTAANVLKREGIVGSVQLAKYTKLNSYLHGRPDCKNILTISSGRQPLTIDYTEVINILALEKVFTERDFLMRRQDEVSLQKIPHHIHRIGTGIFEKVRAKCGVQIRRCK